MAVINKVMSRILIISASFNAGDAITMMNLFSKWDKSDLFLATPEHTPYLNYFSSCYFMGNKECRPFILFRPFIKLPGSSVLKGTNEWIRPMNGVHESKSVTKYVYRQMILPFLKYTGLYGMRYNLYLSDSFSDWVCAVKPDIIYSPVSNEAIMKFIIQCQHKFRDVKYIVHGFDDWLSPSYKVFMRGRYVHRLDRMYKKLISGASLLLATTNKMADEYQKRYGRKFTAFYNPVGCPDGYEKVVFQDGCCHITYIGKIAWHNADAIRNMHKALVCLNARSYIRCILDIYTNTSKEDLKYFKISDDNFVQVHSSVLNSEIMPLLKGSDFLFLPITVSKEVAHFTKFSMSTKMGEYLHSGTPMIYCGPEGIAMTEFVKENKIALYTTESGVQPLLKILESLLESQSMLKEMCYRAKRLSYELFDKEIISEKFYSIVSKV